MYMSADGYMELKRLQSSVYGQVMALLPTLLCVLNHKRDSARAQVARLPRTMASKTTSKLNETMAEAVRSSEQLRTLLKHNTTLGSSAADLLSSIKMIVSDAEDRYAELVAISSEYAELYSADLSDEIKSREAAHHRLQDRIENASALRSAVVALDGAFDRDVCQALKGVQAAVRARPLTEEVSLLDDLGSYITTIQRCCTRLETYWKHEIRSSANQLQADSRGAQWDTVAAELRAVLDADTLISTSPRSTSPPFTPTPSSRHHLLPLPVIHPAPNTQLGHTSATLLHALSLVKHTLLRARTFNRPGFSTLDPKHLTSLGVALTGVENALPQCIQVIQQSIAYADTVVQPAIQRRFVRVAAAQDALRGRAAALVEAPALTDRIDMLSAPSAAGWRIRTALRRVKTRLYAGERIWCALVEPGERQVFAALSRGGEAAAADECSVQQLRDVLCAVRREREGL